MERERTEPKLPKPILAFKQWSKKPAQERGEEAARRIVLGFNARETRGPGLAVAPEFLLEG